MRAGALILGLVVVVAVAALDGLMPGFDTVVSWLMEQQRTFHRALSARLGEAREGGAGWALVGVSFLYGVFHAAGPGHGKAVIAAYLLTQESKVMRGVRLSAASAFMQGAVAVAIVYGLLYLTDFAPRDARQAVAWSERLSFVLLGALGLYLAVRALGALVTSFRPAPAPAGLAFHNQDCGCGTPIAPTASQLQSAAGWRASLGIVLSIGLRPCAGAVLVLVLAKALAMPWAGLASVAAMSAGTAITVAVLAVVTVGARRWAASLLGRPTIGFERAVHLLALAGGVIIAALAASLLAASFQPAHPLAL